MAALNPARIREKLKRGAPSIGGWMQIPNDSVAEIMGTAGFDWIALDLEHGRFSEDCLPSMFRSIAAGGSVPLARLGRVAAYDIKAVLDSGAGGIILPMIDTVELLRDAIAWAHYPPRGVRGVGYSRANLFGKRFDQVLSEADPIVVAQIEHVRAIECIDALLQLPGLDAIMVGPYDLSASMGLTAEFAHPQFCEALLSIVTACRRHGVASGMHVVLPQKDALRAAIADGHRFIAYGTDAVFLWQNATVPDIG
jgi:2-dehydro-3-deoxyglucarate aldolase